MNYNYKIKKAVFPVAGFGTRFLPATKAMPKELLPIVDKPLIQYAVEEAIEAGLDTLIFVTGKNKRAIEDHFDTNLELEESLRNAGKTEQVKMVQNILPKHVECIFVRQPKQLGLGHAILCAERAVGKEPFAVILADDFIPVGEKNITKSLVESYSLCGKNQLSVMKVEGEEISNYGVLKIDKKSKRAVGLIEKPNPQDAPSNLASIGRYVLSPEIFEKLRALSPSGPNNEVQLAEGLNRAAKEDLLDAHLFQGRRFDCGSIEGFLKATNYVAKIMNYNP